jgi:hypothetical protein
MIATVWLWISLLIMYYINYLWTATHMLGVRIADLASIFPFHFMPPGWAFAISRGVIFIGIAGSFGLIAYQYFKYKTLDTHYIRLFFFSILANIIWLLAIGQWWYGRAVVIIALFWIILYAILQHLKTTHQTHSRSWGAWGIYYGRVTVAFWLLSTSQAVYLYNPAITAHPSWIRIATVMTATVVIGSYLRLRNIYALIWSLGALGIALWTMFA